MFRLALALVALVCLGFDTLACGGVARRTPVRTILSRLRPAGHFGERIMDRTVHTVRGSVSGPVTVPVAAPCLTCPAPSPTKK